MIVRPAGPCDLGAIAAIWAPVVAETTIIFASDPRPPARVAEIIAERRKGGTEFFVAETGGRVVGFATYSQFRGGNGYLTSMEHSIIVAPEGQGKGAGRALMEAVEDHARNRGAHDGRRRLARERGGRRLPRGNRLPPIRAPARGRAKVWALARRGLHAENPVIQ